MDLITNRELRTTVNDIDEYTNKLTEEMDTYLVDSIKI